MSELKIPFGKSWDFGAPITGSAFNEDGIGAFACGDGTLRFFADEREPQSVEVHKGAILSLALHPKAGFLTGGDDGRLVHTIPGEAPIELFAQKGKWIDNVTSSEVSGLIACTAGKDAVVFDGTNQIRFSHATSATGVAFDPKGRRLAVSHYNGASLWWSKSASQEPTVLNWKGSHLGVIWSPDGKFLITTMQESALHGWRIEDAADMRMSGYPAKIKSLAWEHRGKVLMTSGSTCVVGWSFTGRNGPMGKEPIEIGPTGDAMVDVVATHPEFDLVAGGSSEGDVWMEWLSEPDASYVGHGLPAMTCMTFSPDGTNLAIGTQDGLAALIDAT